MPDSDVLGSDRRGDAIERPLERHERKALEDDAAGRGVLFISPVLRDFGFRHGFSTRRGGTSSPPFDTLNLAIAASPPGATRDQPERIADNRRRFLAACGLAGLPWLRARQVHGAAVASADSVEIGAETDVLLGDADAIVADRPDRAIAVATADCVPILLACPRSGRVAAVHAGWRGLVAGVIERAVAELTSRGSSLRELLAAIGPSIGVEAYRVGPEVVEAFRSRDLSTCIQVDGAATQVSCHDAARWLLIRSGIAASHIDGMPLCTHANPEDFFSHRRDGPSSGRMAAVIAAHATAPRRASTRC